MGSHHEIFSSPPSSPEETPPVKIKVTKGKNAIVIGGVIALLGFGAAVHEGRQTYTDDEIQTATTEEAKNMEEFNDQQWDYVIAGGIIGMGGLALAARGIVVNAGERDRIDPLPNQKNSLLKPIFE